MICYYDQIISQGRLIKTQVDLQIGLLYYFYLYGYLVILSYYITFISMVT